MLKIQSANFETQQFGQHTLADKSEWLLGRLEVCDLILEQPEISKVHAKIQLIENEFYLIDAGSRNGTFVNNQKLVADVQHRLQEKDCIRLGKTILEIEEIRHPVLEPTASKSDQTALWTTQDLTLRCFRIMDETPDTKTFWFVAEPPVWFQYYPGQFVTIAANINGKRVLKPYTIASSPLRPHAIAITVKRVLSASADSPPGLVSNWLHDYFEVGQTLEAIDGARGSFSCLPTLPSKLLLIAAGSGITPMMSMLRWLFDAPAQIDVVLIYSCKTPSDIIYRQELELFAAQLPNFRLVVTVTQSQSRILWMGLSGRISEALLQQLVPDLTERSTFVCGPESFMVSIKQILEAMQFPMEQYFEESFGNRPTAKLATEAVSEAADEIGLDFYKQDELPADVPPDPTQNGRQSQAQVIVYFTESKREAIAHPEQSILAIAEQAGISTIVRGCGVGVCGGCKKRVKGQVKYQATPDGLTPAEQEAGYVLTCIAYPYKTIEAEA
ncbi:FHA domain-containing protein [Leptolyngbya sp. AN03gr2]|uniref:FHA domain-containing protein n=1 Tax=unclassified Leptolyngbya TaxID=2650499 RepID=UPI003D31FE0D